MLDRFDRTPRLTTFHPDSHQQPLAGIAAHSEMTSAINLLAECCSPTGRGSAGTHSGAQPTVTGTPISGHPGLLQLAEAHDSREFGP